MYLADNGIDNLSFMGHPLDITMSMLVLFDGQLTICSKDHWTGHHAGYRKAQIGRDFDERPLKEMVSQ